MDVKTNFLNMDLEEGVWIEQPWGHTSQEDSQLVQSLKESICGPG
jgi:hypothetical protein